MSVLRLLCLALALSAGAARAQLITKLPMPQSFRTNELRVQWETDADPPGSVHRLEWGTVNPNQNNVLALTAISPGPGRFVHRAIATGLTPETEYVYRVRSGASQSATYSVRTAPRPATPFRMAFVADNQNQAGAPFLSVLTKLAAHAPDVIGHAGDTVQNGDMANEWDEQWFTPLTAAPGNLAQTTPILVGRGNHDAETALALAYHWLSGNGYWCAETIGRTRFVFLDSNTQYPEQLDFLRAELASPASRDADFRVVVFHKPAYTNLWDTADYRGDEYVRDNWVPLLEQGKVDLVVNGHTHAYERGALNGVTYTVVGGAGGALDTVVQSPPWSFISVAASTHHYAIMDVNGPKLRWTAYDLADQVIDSFELTSTRSGIPVFPTESVR